jgi:oligopeptide transport system substrate-binding protein
MNRKHLARARAMMLAGILTAAMLVSCTTADHKPVADPTYAPSAQQGEPGAETPAPEGERKDTFTFVNQEPNTLNMKTSASNLDSYVFYLTSAMLFRSYDGAVSPELCKEMTVSEDLLTYTYTLNEAKYTNGDPITVDDLIYAFCTVYLDSANSAWFVGGEETYSGGLATCEGVKRIDDHTFSVTLTAPNVAFDGKMQLYPLQHKFAEEKGDALGGTPEDLMYSGPYVLKEWVKGSYMTFEKNPDYIAAQTSFPTQNIKMYNTVDASTAYSMYTSGQVDMILSTNADMVEMLGGEGCVPYATGALQGLEFNTTGYTYKEGDGFVTRDEAAAALMKNKNFRMALCYALDREAIISSVDPASTPYNRYIAPSAVGKSEESLYVEDTQIEGVPLSGDAEKAKEYLAAALSDLGYESADQLPKVTYLTFDSATYKLISETIISTWKQVLGIDNVQLALQPVQSAIMSMVYMDYDIYYQSLTMNAINPTELMNLWITTGAVSDAAGFQAGGAPSQMASMHADPAYDEVMAKVMTTMDRVERTALLNQAEQLLYDSYAYFPLLAGGKYYVVSDKVTGFVNNVTDNGYTFNQVVVAK